MKARRFCRRCSRQFVSGRRESQEDREGKQIKDDEDKNWLAKDDGARVVAVGSDEAAAWEM